MVLACATTVESMEGQRPSPFGQTERLARGQNDVEEIQGAPHCCLDPVWSVCVMIYIVQEETPRLGCNGRS